jgi:hypothetical protein
MSRQGDLAAEESPAHGSARTINELSTCTWTAAARVTPSKHALDVVGKRAPPPPMFGALARHDHSHDDVGPVEDRPSSAQMMQRRQHRNAAACANNHKQCAQAL